MKLLPCIAYSFLAMVLPALAAAQTASPVAQSRPSITEVVEKMQSVYDSTSDFRAEFVQEYKPSGAFKGAMNVAERVEQKGVIQFKKKGKMRWEYSSPHRRLFISDGRKLWMYDPDARTVTVNDNFRAELLPASISFLWGEGKLKEEFEIDYIQGEFMLGEPGDLLIKLKPKEGKKIVTAMFFVVDPKSYRVKEAIVFDPARNKNHLKFRNLTPNTGLADSLFTFTPPPGTETIKAPPL
ncbi:MAG: Outer-membrane lipoprotein carrier protein [Myxococcota bacterium]|nr:Outer-membrane lipoprotein carrier protein [Myxococcota bacterium]